jgi:ribosomal protein S18 acetylase RimI-like enzyme
MTGNIDLHRINKGNDNSDRAAELIAALAGEIWREHYTGIIGAAQVDYMLSKYQSPGQILQDIKVNEYTYYMALRRNTDGARAVRDDSTSTGGFDGEAVGYASCQPRGEHLFLSKLYVRNGFRKQGLARRFLNAATSLSREYGLDKIRLTVNKNNADSIAAYGKLGFKIIDAAVSDIGGGFVMDDYIMELTID